MRLKDLFQWQQVSGQSVTVHDITLTPQSQVLTVRFPLGACVWHRPTAVLVKQGQLVRRIPIVDITRILQLGLLGFSILITIVSVIKFARRKE